MSPERARWPRIALAIALVAVVSGAALVLSPVGDRLLGGTARGAAGRNLFEPPRRGPLATGLRPFVDVTDRFSVGVPRDFVPEAHGPDEWRFRGPEKGSSPSYMLIEIQPENASLPPAAIDAARDDQIRKQSNLPLTKLSSEPGTLDGWPAQNRSYILGPYQCWEVAVATPEGLLFLTMLTDARRFEERQETFRQVLTSFRAASAAPTATGGDSGA